MPLHRHQRCTRSPRPLPTIRSRLALPLALLAGLAALLIPVSLAAQRSEPNWHATPLRIEPHATPGFLLLPPHATGVAFTNHLTELAGTANRVLENGSGVAVGDYDRDGRPDLFFCGLAGNSTLYRNLGGWRFEDATTNAGLRLTQEVCRGAVFADLDGDEFPELLVSTLSRGVLCWHNQGGRFHDATETSGTGGPPGSTTLALADIDGNGLLDLYVTRYRADDIRDSSLVEARQVAGRTELHPKYAGRLIVGPTGLIEFGEPDILYRNDGHGRFQPIPWTLGTFLDEDGRILPGAPRDWGLTASFRDLNQDGWPDLFVCNDYWTPDRLWLNNGNGTFRLAPRPTLRHTSENSMGVDFADLDRDGHLDFLVLDMLDPDPRVRRRQALAQTPVTTDPGEVFNRPQIMQNTLYRGRADGTFAEIAAFAGIASSGWSWQPLFLDVDLDGFEDVLIPTGHRRDVQDLDATERIRQLQQPWPATRDPQARQEAFQRRMMEHGRLYPSLEGVVAAFRNLGHCRFTETTDTWGLGPRGVHQGSALADLDADGDLDLVVNNLNSVAGLYRNLGTAPRIAVRLHGLPPNTDAIGARVTLHGGAVPVQSQEVVAGGRYLSGSQPLLSFAAGTGLQPITLEVRWRSGRHTTITHASPNHFYEIRETNVAPAPTPAPTAPPKSPPLFADQSPRLGHRHHQSPSEPPPPQPLLHRRRTREGPAIALLDLNHDTWPDLLVGAGAGGRPALFTNDTRGGFSECPLVPSPTPSDFDTTGIVSFRHAHPGPSITSTVHAIVASLRPPHSDHPSALHELPLPPAHQPNRPIDSTGPVGPLALGDMDGDGQLVLFAGGSALPGRYPEASPSRIYRRTAAGWQVDDELTAAIRDLGVVQAAVWGDLDGDGDSDLVVACDWSPIRVFRSNHRQLADMTREWGFETRTGWWLGVTLGDIDGDGQLDIIAGNWGLNTPVSPAPGRPTVLAYGDLLDRGTVDLIHGDWDARNGTLSPRHRLTELQAALPLIRDHFPTHHRFVQASFDDVLRAFARPIPRREANTLASSIFFRRGNRFEWVPLPDEAQYTPAFGVLVSDFDADGHEDIVLTQNCFAVPPEVPRLDAGRGLLLRGIGQGQLRAMDPAESGIQVDGEQRGAAFADVDRDGRLDLVISQNGAETRYLRNQAASPGIRVHLDAGRYNPDGIGSVIRVIHPSGAGPTRPVLAGSGWWSQSSPTLVIPRPAGTARLSVRWPNGEHHEVDLSAETIDLRIQRDPPAPAP